MGERTGSATEAGVAELADAHDSKSCEVTPRVGSTPTSGTNIVVRGSSFVIRKENIVKVKSYKELNIWKKGLDIVDKIYKITESFPGLERYGLASQMQRCAVSIPSNIAEGFVRHYTKEYEQFLYVALGSCAELETHLVISKRMEYITEEQLEDLQEVIDHESRMLMSLIKSLR